MELFKLSSLLHHRVSRHETSFFLNWPFPDIKNKNLLQIISHKQDGERKSTWPPIYHTKQVYWKNLCTIYGGCTCQRILQRRSAFYLWMIIKILSPKWNRIYFVFDSAPNPTRRKPERINWSTCKNTSKELTRYGGTLESFNMQVCETHLIGET